MVKIQFQDNITKANANTFNTMQDNVENAISDSVSGIIKRASVNITGVNAFSGKSVSANVPTGYVFLCWLTPVSYGNVNSAYMETYWNQTTNIWQTTNNSSNNSFTCPYLMVKNGILAG